MLSNLRHCRFCVSRCRPQLPCLYGGLLAGRHSMPLISHHYLMVLSCFVRLKNGSSMQISASLLSFFPFMLCCSNVFCQHLFNYPSYQKPNLAVLSVEASLPSLASLKGFGVARWRSACVSTVVVWWFRSSGRLSKLSESQIFNFFQI